MWERMREDIEVILEKDPAARSKFEIVLTYPGLHAIWFYRISHWFWIHRCKTFGRWLSSISRFLTGIEIHPGASIGRRLFIDHGMGVVIGETAEIHDNVTLYQGVTLGGTNLVKVKRHPTLEDNVVVGAGAKILGSFTIGKGSRIGANSVVVKAVPANSVVVGVPGQIIVRTRRESPEQDQMPDAIGVTLNAVLNRLDHLENNLKNNPVKESKTLRGPQLGVWNGDDFMI